MQTENNYAETDLGNIAPNPMGDYNSAAEYEYLDHVTMQGGSYLCLAELGQRRHQSQGKQQSFGSALLCRETERQNTQMHTIK